MAIEKDAVFLLTSTDSGKKAFGTGFAVACKEGKLYLLTCAHVIEQLGGRVVASGADAVPHEAAIEAAGSSNTVDLALLSIRHDGDAPPLLNRPAKGKPDMLFQILGYGPHFGARENYVLRDIQGRLGKPISFKAVGIKSIEAWDIHVDDDEFSKLQGGYSGSPLCDAAGSLLAVVSHNADAAAGQRGHAVAVVNLQAIFPEIEQLLPAFAGLAEEHLDPAARINQAMMQLSGRAFEICSIFPAIGLELERMRKEGISEDDEEIFAEINGFAARTIAAEAFIFFFSNLDNRRKAVASRPDYTKLAGQLQNGQVILCLGQELSHLLGAELPSTEAIKQHLSQNGFHGPLSELCEQKELALNSSRADLVNDIRALFNADPKKSPVALHDLLANLKNPFLVISTAYDDLLEQSLRGRRKFAVIHPNMEDKRCLLRCSDQKDVFCTPEELSSFSLLESGYAVIYQLRGGIFNDKGHLLLSERDYFTFTRFMQQQFPDYIGSKLKNSLHSLWFLGHHPESWEERLLIKSLQELRHDRAPSLAIQEGGSSFAQSFWQDRKVKVYDCPLKDFVQELALCAAG